MFQHGQEALYQRYDYGGAKEGQNKAADELPRNGTRSTRGDQFLVGCQPASTKDIRGGDYL